MPAFTRKFPIEVEDAVASAFIDRGIRPMPRVLELLKAGELAPDIGAHDVPEATARAWCANLRRRRAGQVVSGAIKDLKPEQAIDAVLLRLIASADQGMTAQERLKPEKRDWDVHRQIARALREAKALITQPRGVRPGERSPDTGDMDNGGATRGGLAGSILASHRAGGHRTEPPPSQQDEEGHS